MMFHFDEHVIKDLEFDLIRLMLHDLCIGETARLRAAELTPHREPKLIEKELQETKEFHRIRTEGYSFPALDYQELEIDIQRLSIVDSTLAEESFMRILSASHLVNTMIYFFNKQEEDFPRLWSLFENVYHTQDIIAPIEQVFDNKGIVRNDASPELARIRQEQQSVRRKINRNFIKVMKTLVDKGYLADTKEGFVNDRRVLALNSTHKRKVPGIAMGSSKTGSVTYIEPQSNVPLNYEFEMLRDDERREIHRILMALSKEIRGHVHLISGYQGLLTQLDFISAKTRLALEMQADLPGVSKEMEIDLVNAYHPILMLSNKKAGIKTHPHSLRMDKFSRMLVISGPNAGGKSISLKMIGLLQVMLQSGLLIPVDSNSKFTFFQSVLTDIGDNQSIENQLSTYSYRLKRMRHFLEVANRKSLLLLDEFGTGSDPELGGALAEVFFEQLYNRKSFGVITTHYANIKLKAAELHNAINGSMLFDKVSLEPLYKLDIGQPGSSFTFEVAEINGIPKELIEEAKQRLDENKVKMDGLIASLQTEKTELSKLRLRTTETEKKALDAMAKADRQKKKFEARQATQDEIIAKNNHLLVWGKKVAAFIDRYNTRSKAKGNKELLEEVRQYLAIEKTKIEEGKKAETLKRKAAEAKNPKKKRPKANQDKIRVGSTVRLIAGGKQRGTVMELDGEKATVNFGVFRTKVELGKLAYVH
ncbi:MAG: DNA mismatch repair protein MutS [Flavobacteriales bacterium]|nr:DNA mismatch repair protein MutS [Flavobacteriales bacterium]MDG2247088.1 DNA mismatch repair protein MutS [Flavobacteriales bacterium]